MVELGAPPPGCCAAATRFACMRAGTARTEYRWFEMHGSHPPLAHCLVRSGPGAGPLAGSGLRYDDAYFQSANENFLPISTETLITQGGQLRVEVTTAVVRHQCWSPSSTHSHTRDSDGLLADTEDSLGPSLMPDLARHDGMLALIAENPTAGSSSGRRRSCLARR